MNSQTAWEVWKCAKCGREKVQPALPHNPPSCCGTGMWWERFLGDDQRRKPERD